MSCITNVNPLACGHGDEFIELALNTSFSRFIKGLHAEYQLVNEAWSVQMCIAHPHFFEITSCRERMVSSVYINVGGHVHGHGTGIRANLKVEMHQHLNLLVRPYN